MTQTIAAEITRKQLNRKLILASPLILTATNYLTARLGVHFFGQWAWVPFQIGYWLVITLLIRYSGGWKVVLEAYKRPTGWGWWIPCIVIGLIPLPILLHYRGLIHQPLLIASWLIIAVVNPFFEERYWRGVFGDVTEKWPTFLACLYPTFFFACGHPLGLGVFSIGCRRADMLISLFVMGFVWSYIYRKTRSLRAVTFSHNLIDLFNMSVWVYMNILIPKNGF